MESTCDLLDGKFPIVGLLWKLIIVVFHPDDNEYFIVIKTHSDSDRVPVFVDVRTEPFLDRCVVSRHVDASYVCRGRNYLITPLTLKRGKF